MITLGQIRDDIQADYFENFSEIKAIKRAIKRVFDKINLKLQGIDTLEEGLELIVAPTTEKVIFGATNNLLTLTTAPPAALEQLTEGDFATHANWDVTNDLVDSGGNATYTWSATQTSTLTQVTAKQLRTAKSAQAYRLTYDLTETVAFDGDGAITITTGFASEATTIPLTAGTGLTVDFTSAATPANFVISIISGTDTQGTYVFDNLSLKQTGNTVEPGDVFVSYGGLYNNKKLNISRVDVTNGIEIVPDNLVYDETSTVTYAIYRPKRKYLLEKAVQSSLTYAATTITSVGQEIDFLEMGVKAGDFALTEKVDTTAALAVNRGLFKISAVAQYVLTISAQGSSGTMATQATTATVLSIFAPPDDLHSYDLKLHKVIMAPSVKLLNGIVAESTSLTSRSYPFIKDSGNDDAEAFSPVGRLEAMLADTVFVGAGAKLRFNVKRDLVPPVSSYPDTVIDIPQKYEGTLFWGVLRAVASLPRNYNKEIYDLAYQEYQTALAELDNSEPSVNPPIEHKLKFHF
jgi:hypothetical protein